MCVLRNISVQNKQKTKVFEYILIEKINKSFLSFYWVIGGWGERRLLGDIHKYACVLKDNLRVVNGIEENVLMDRHNFLNAIHTRK